MKTAQMKTILRSLMAIGMSLIIYSCAKKHTYKCKSRYYLTPNEEIEFTERRTQKDMDAFVNMSNSRGSTVTCTRTKW
jgi:hypothetical protein